MPDTPGLFPLPASDASAEVDLLLDDLVSEPGDASPAERLVHRTAVQSRRGGADRAVLVVDSVPIARKFLVQRLRALGYDAHGVEDGERAVSALQTRAFTIVFSELSLSGAMDGLDLCVAIKQAPIAPGMVPPAVVITAGEAGSTLRVRGSLAGCDAYLNKPLIESDLVAALRTVDALFK